MRIAFRNKLGALMLVSGMSFSQTTNTVVKAKIESDELGEHLKIRGVVENLTNLVQCFSYKLTIIEKKGISENQSNIVQEGVFWIEPSQTKKLSDTYVKIKKGDEVIVLLLFYDEKKQLIGKDRMVLTDKKKDKIVLAMDGFEMKGIVSDETKTKIGKDFYDRYYYMYTDGKINASKIVVVSEELSFARSTKIIITIENEIIYEFIARPDEEFMSNMTDSSIYATIIYFKNLEKQEKYFIQY